MLFQQAFSAHDNYINYPLATIRPGRNVVIAGKKITIAIATAMPMRKGAVPLKIVVRGVSLATPDIT